MQEDYIINLFIFYSDILAAGRNVFFSSISPSFPTVFEAILTLNVPFDVCFYEGFDAYVKTWLSIAFPVYLFSLVIVFIIISHVSQKFARLIGKNDPVATLSTLVLICYSKL